MKSKKNSPTDIQTSTAGASGPTHEQISLLAHTLWLEEGKPQGRELHHWHEAERQLRAGGVPEGTGAGGAGVRNGSYLSTRDVESDKRVDGLAPPRRDPRTPKSEQL